MNRLTFPLLTSKFYLAVNTKKLLIKINRVIISLPGKYVFVINLINDQSSALGPTQPSIQWVLQVRQLGHEINHSPPI
jgi:hypothetical protein